MARLLDALVEALSSNALWVLAGAIVGHLSAAIIATRQRKWDREDAEVRREAERQHAALVAQQDRERWLMLERARIFAACAKALRHWEAHIVNVAGRVRDGSMDRITSVQAPRPGLPRWVALGPSATRASVEMTRASLLATDDQRALIRDVVGAGTNAHHLALTTGDADVAITLYREKVAEFVREWGRAS
jgi:hypothetical protein